jgi:hypothetical protein
VQNTESLLSPAGFRTQTPSTLAQLATYNRTAPYRLERNTINGKGLYSYADKKKGVVYIGGTKRISATANWSSGSRWPKKSVRRGIAITSTV